MDPIEAQSWEEIEEVLEYRLGDGGFVLQVVRTDGPVFWALLDPAGDVVARGEGEPGRIEADEEPHRASERGRTAET